MTELEQVVAAELDRPAPAAAEAVACALRQRHGGSIAAILFYGSCRRTLDMDGLLDLYVLHDGHAAFHRRRLLALLNRLLPPNVVLLTVPHDGRTIRAKVAILSAAQFARRMRPASLDTTLWARFSQPATALYLRDTATHHWLVAMVASGIATAAHWAVTLGPASASAATYWQVLFTHTYGAELRPESGDRPALVYAADAAWFDRILPLALALVPDADGMLHPVRPATRRSWIVRRVAGKVLNVLRLAKAVFTFDDGADYIAWKVERHTGRALHLTDWQRAHPLLAAPLLLWKLRGLSRGNGAG